MLIGTQTTVRAPGSAAFHLIVSIMSTVLRAARACASSKGEASSSPSSGCYDIIREMEERSGGFYSPSPGAVYPTLQALEDQDLVTSTTEEGKKIYSLTEAGLAFLEEHKERARRHHDRWEAQWGSGLRSETREAMNDIRDAFADLRRSVRRSAGDPGKMKEICEVLEEAAARIKDIAKR